MVFGGGCEPDVDWSLCEEETGFPRVLPAFYIVSAALYGVTAVLYTISMVRTLRLQLKEKKKMSYNTAVQMHAGILTFSVAAFIHGVSLVSPQPGMPALPLLLLVHLRYICVGYVTTVLVRHWAVLYQQMGKNQQTQGQLNERIARFVELYRDGEVIQAVATCSFFFGSVVYGVKHEDNWVQVERLQFLVWAILSGTTCWLVSVLGQRVHANMKRVASSRAVLDYVRRVKYVVIGSCLLWCQCTVCFSIGAAFDRPLSARTWLLVHGGIVLTGNGAGFLYYIVIGSKHADKAAHAVAAASLPAEGVKQVQRKFKALAKFVASGANQFMEGVSTITGMADTSARVHMKDNSDNSSVRRIASLRWSGSRRRADTGTGKSARLSGSTIAPGLAPGSGGEEPGESSNTKLPMPNVSDEEIGLYIGGADDRGMVEEKLQEEAPWESPVSPMMAKTPSQRGSFEDTTLEDDAAHSGEEDSRDRHQRRDPASRKRSSSSRAHNSSSEDPAKFSGEPPFRDEEETWKVEELDNRSSRTGSHDGSNRSSHHHSRSSTDHSCNNESGHGSYTERGHSEGDGGSHSYDSRSHDSDAHSWT